MEGKNIHQGGCNLTWRIENCSFIKNVYQSPGFYLSQSQKAEWYLEMTYQESSCFCYLKSMNCLEKITLYFDVCISSEWESENYSGTRTFPDEEQLQLAKLLLKKRLIFGNLSIRVRLKDICDSDGAIRCLSFRSVEEVEFRRVNYEIPFYDVWSSNHDVVVRVVPVFPNSIPFEMEIGGFYERDEDKDKTLHINISESSKLERFGLFCKVICEDQCRKSVGASEQYHVFEKEAGKRCTTLKISFDKDTLKSFYSRKYVLSFKFEFSTTEGKSVSWIEKSISQSISIESPEKERDNLRDDFLDLYLESKGTDIEIIADGRNFLAHKKVLRARSPVFAAMFDANMKEKESSVVEIVDAEAETLDQMLFYMYSKSLKTKEYGNIVKLYETADKYEVLILREECSAILKRNLDTQNTLELLHLADLHQDAELQNSIEMFIFGNAKTVFNSEGWKVLIESEPSLGCKVMHKFCMTNV